VSTDRRPDRGGRRLGPGRRRGVFEDGLRTHRDHGRKEQRLGQGLGRGEEVTRERAVEHHGGAGPHGHGLSEWNIGHHPAVVETPSVVIDGGEDAGDGGAGKQRGQQRANVDDKGSGGDDVHRNCSEGKREVTERPRRTEEVCDHRGKAGIGKEVRLRMLESPRLSEQPAGEDLVPCDACPRVTDGWRRWWD